MAKTQEEKAAEKAAKEKNVLLAKLAEFGVTVESGGITGNESNADLAAALDKCKADAKLKAAEEKAAEKAATSSSGPITFKYRDHKGDVAERTFSEADHGPDFAKVAAEFAQTNATKLVKEA